MHTKQWPGMRRNVFTLSSDSAWKAVTMVSNLQQCQINFNPQVLTAPRRLLYSNLTFSISNIMHSVYRILLRVIDGQEAMQNWYPQCRCGPVSLLWRSVANIIQWPAEAATGTDMLFYQKCCIHTKNLNYYSQACMQPEHLPFSIHQQYFC